MAKGKTIQEQFTELTPSRLKEIRGYIVRKYLSERIDQLEKKGKYKGLPIDVMNYIPEIKKYLLHILLDEI